MFVAPALRTAVLSVRHEGTTRITCPVCTPSRLKHHQHLKDLSVTRIGDRVVFKCHHCGIANTLREEAADWTPPKKKQEAPKEERPLPMELLSDKAIDYLKVHRNISAEVARREGVFSTRMWFRDLGREADAIGFPYRDQTGKHYATKVRALEDKAFTCHGSPQDFQGLDQIAEGEDLLIVEGEFDRLAYAECGVKAISVPHGTSSLPSSAPIDRAKVQPVMSKFLVNAQAHIEKAKRIVIAVDNDKVGTAFGEELARRM